MNNQEINLEEESTIMADEAAKKWMNWIDSLIRGKKISFRGMLWESKGHQWEDFTVTVAAIRPILGIHSTQRFISFQTKGRTTPS
jgi:hypothetical protein